MVCILVATSTAAFAPALQQPLRHVSGRAAAPVCQMEKPNSYGGDGMKDINKAGPSEDRQGEIEALMAKLRKSGRVGDSSELAAGEEFMANAVTPLPPPPPPAPPPESPPPIEVKAPSFLTEEQTDATEAEADEGEVKKTTTGIGGSWDAKKAATVEKHKPANGGWGLFERPADISKAYGGGRQIGVGGYTVTEEEIAKKRAETEAKLRAYRSGMGADVELQDAHTDEIVEAAKEARQLMRYGATKAALDELKKVQDWCCVTTDLGSETLLEVAMAMIAEKDNEGAKPVLNNLANRAPKPKIKRAAQQLLFQEKAQKFLKVADDPNDEFAKLGRAGLGRSLGVANDKRYDIAAAYLTSSKRPPVASLSEARMVLRSAAVRRDDAGAPQRITQAITLMKELPRKERLPPTAALSAGAADDAAADGAPPAMRLMRGEWLLGFTASGKSTAFAPGDASLTLQDARKYESLAPATIGLVKSTGTFSLTSEEKDELSLRLEVESSRLGPLPYPTQSSTRRVLFLDALMCILEAEGGGYSVYVRPTMSRPTDDDE